MQIVRPLYLYYNYNTSLKVPSQITVHCRRPCSGVIDGPIGHMPSFDIVKFEKHVD